MTRLRGAGVDVDVRRAARVFVGGSLIALAVVTGILFAAGVGKNTQINLLHQHGVPVTVTVSGCIGLMGGSGSNLAGYSCHGTFLLDGHRHSDAIPGDTLLRPGSTVRGVSVSSDPGLLSTVGALATQHSSSRVFLLPTILLIVLVVLGLGVFRAWRHRSAPRRTVATSGWRPPGQAGPVP
jgi:hypothetical protein